MTIIFKNQSHIYRPVVSKLEQNNYFKIIDPDGVLKDQSILDSKYNIYVDNYSKFNFKTIGPYSEKKHPIENFSTTKPYIHFLNIDNSKRIDINFAQTAPICPVPEPSPSPSPLPIQCTNLEGCNLVVVLDYPGSPLEYSNEPIGMLGSDCELSGEIADIPIESGGDISWTITINSNEEGPPTVQNINIVRTVDSPDNEQSCDDGITNCVPVVFYIECSTPPPSIEPTPPPDIGACCFPDGTCQDDMSENGCDYYGGTFYPGSSCSEITCSTPTVPPEPYPS